MLKKIWTAGALSLLAATAAAATAAPVRVAFVISEGANVMDIAGPWEVFQDTMLDDGKDTMPFELYTVAPSTLPLQTTGSGRPGMTLTPDYSFDKAPAPDIVVVGAQSGGPELRAWLKKQADQGTTMLSICTGAFQLGRAGLLDGKRATTHHWYFGNFSEEFPNTTLVREVRYVQAAPQVYTAGGLTSGVDLALHIVAERYGVAQAERTADYMEYQGQGWRSNSGVTMLNTPVKQQVWSGRLAPDSEVLVHVVTTGASLSVTTDLPARHVLAAPTRVKSTEQHISFSLMVDGQAATFDGDQRGAASVQGTFSYGGQRWPLTLNLRQ